MFALITITFFVGLGLYYITGLDFEVGTGFTEMKKKARDVDYEVVDKENSKQEDQKMLQ